jgi:hypothetical protein
VQVDEDYRKLLVAAAAERDLPADFIQLMVDRSMRPPITLRVKVRAIPQTDPLAKAEFATPRAPHQDWRAVELNIAPKTDLRRKRPPDPETKEAVTPKVDGAVDAGGGAEGHEEECCSRQYGGRTGVPGTAAQDTLAI